MQRPLSSNRAMRSLPVIRAPFCGAVEELRAAPDVERAFIALADQPHCIFFDSARQQRELGRYSFLAADPYDVVQLSNQEAITATAAKQASVFALLDARLAPFATETIPGLPPFQGGMAGVFSYDLNRTVERIPAARFDEFSVPALAVGLYDVVLAIDHVEQKAWIVSQGWPERDLARRRQRAEDRLKQFKDWSRVQGSGFRIQGTDACALAVSSASLAPQFPVLSGTELTSNFSCPEYLKTVEDAIEYIRAGDIFQVNLAQRLLHPARDDSPSLYLRMRRRNPAPFAAYFDLGEFQIVSASPERFLNAVNHHVEARPIKGTRRRCSSPEADLFAGDELLQSEKDRAENVMIVDLLRNDLSRVCTPESVRVSELCRLESYEFVQHLVSVVRGELRPECGPFALLAASFPGGSITGAPKVRAMEIIAELEPTARGAYCGCLGYIGFDGAMDTNILIRTITAGRGWWQLPVGGGIVAQSDPLREYEETWHKAEGILRALE
ncbi:MAG: anthranilate synthase component I family protein [Pirellulales bacterium]